MKTPAGLSTTRWLVPTLVVCSIAGVAGTPACYGEGQRDPVSKALITRPSAPPPIQVTEQENQDFKVPPEARPLEFRAERIEIAPVFLRRAAPPDEKKPMPASAKPDPAAGAGPASQEQAPPAEPPLRR